MCYIIFILLHIFRERLNGSKKDNHETQFNVRIPLPEIDDYLNP